VDTVQLRNDGISFIVKSLNIWDGYFFEMIYSNIFVTPLFLLIVFEIYLIFRKFHKKEKVFKNFSTYGKIEHIVWLFILFVLLLLPLYSFASTVYFFVEKFLN